MLSKEKIREIFLANGFSVKDGQEDLKPYVYQAANALISATVAEIMKHPPMKIVVNETGTPLDVNRSFTDVELRTLAQLTA